MTEPALTAPESGDAASPERSRRGALPGQKGQAPFEPTEDMRTKVRSLAKQFGESGERRIALVLGISRATLRKYFTDDLDLGRAELVQQVAQKFILATIGGWSKTVEVTGKGGGPVRTVDLSRLTPEQLDAYGRLAAAAEGLDPDDVVRPA